MMTVHHFTERELRDMAAQVESREIVDPVRRGPPRAVHGYGDHWLRFVAMIPGSPDMPDMARGRFCVYRDCKYTDQGSSTNTALRGFAS